MLEDAEAYGLELPPGKLRGQDFEVWEENWQAVDLFLLNETQWHIGERLPVWDYSSVLEVASLYLPDPAVRKRVFEQVRIMERRVLELCEERRSS